MVWFYGISIIVGYLIANQFLYIKTVLFQTIRFSISTQFTSIRPIDRTLSGDTSPGLSGPRSDGNKGVICIPQSSSKTGASPSDYLVSYTGHSLRQSYPSGPPSHNSWYVCISISNKCNNSSTTVISHLRIIIKREFKNTFQIIIEWA